MLNKHRNVNLKLTLLFSWFQVVLASYQNTTLTQCLKLMLNKHRNLNLKLTLLFSWFRDVLASYQNTTFIQCIK